MNPRPKHSRSGPKWLRIAAVVCGLAVLAGCAKDNAQQSVATKPGRPAPAGGIGGTGFADNGMGGTGMGQERPGGLGGTGLADQRAGGVGGTGLADQPPGGIGGTGLAGNGLGGTGLRDWGTIGANGMGGTGIVGIVTGFGSIWVNGLEVELDGATAVQRNGAPAKADVLAVGQLVAIQSEGRGGRLFARSVDTAPLLEGPVQSADSATGMLTVLGQRVHIGIGTLLPTKDFPAVGDTLRVYGLTRGDGTIEAASVARSDRAGTVRLSGTLVAQGGRWSVAGVPVILGSGVSAGSLTGKPVVVAGTWDGNRLQATALQADPVATVLARVAQVTLQGYLKADATAGTIQVGGVRLRVNVAPANVSGATLSQAQERLVVLSGTMSPDQSITVTRLRVLERVLSTGGLANPPPASTGDTGSASTSPPPSTGGTGSAANPPAAGTVDPGGPNSPKGQPANLQRPAFAGSGNPWGGPPAAPPKGPPPGVPGGPPPGKGPPGGGPPGPPPGKPQGGPPPGPPGGGPPPGPPPGPPGGGPPGGGPPGGGPPGGGPPGGGPPGGNHPGGKPLSALRR